jgi:hypothetical protein
VDLGLHDEDAEVITARIAKKDDKKSNGSGCASSGAVGGGVF